MTFWVFVFVALHYSSVSSPHLSLRLQNAASGALEGSRDHHFQCKQALDSLDQTFDLRRQGRIASTSAIQPGTTVPESVLFDPYEPESTCLSEERVGGMHRYSSFGDGPKFVCGVNYIKEVYSSEKFAGMGKPCLAYSVGSYNRIEFEQFAKIHLGCEVHTFDPTLTESFVGDAYATFHPWGFGKDGELIKLSTVATPTKNSTKISVETMSLRRVMTQLNHISDTPSGAAKLRKLDILKIDCEGCEYEAILEAFYDIAAGVLEVDQIQVEVHGLFTGISDLPLKLKEFFLAADSAKMRVFHKERNGWGCRGTGCIEYAFVSESFLRRANAYAMKCPTSA